MAAKSYLSNSLLKKNRFLDEVVGQIVSLSHTLLIWWLRSLLFMFEMFLFVSSPMHVLISKRCYIDEYTETHNQLWCVSVYKWLSNLHQYYFLYGIHHLMINFLKGLIFKDLERTFNKFDCYVTAMYTSQILYLCLLLCLISFSTTK